MGDRGANFPIGKLNVKKRFLTELIFRFLHSFGFQYVVVFMCILDYFPVI